MEKTEARLLDHKFPGQPSLQGQWVGAQAVSGNVLEN